MKKITLLVFFVLLTNLSIKAQEKPHLFDAYPKNLTVERNKTGIDNPQAAPAVGVEMIIPTKEKFPFKTKVLQKKIWDDGSVTTLYELKGDFPPETYMVINKIKNPNGRGFLYKGSIMNKKYDDAYLISDEIKNQLNFEKVNIGQIICTPE